MLPLPNSKSKHTMSLFNANFTSKLAKRYELDIEVTRAPGTEYASTKILDSEILFIEVI